MSLIRWGRGYAMQSSACRNLASSNSGLDELHVGVEHDELADERMSFMITPSIPRKQRILLLNPIENQLSASFPIN